MEPTCNLPLGILLLLLYIVFTYLLNYYLNRSY